VTYAACKALSERATEIGLGDEWVKVMVRGEVHHNALAGQHCGASGALGVAVVRGLAWDGGGLCTECTWSDAELVSLAAGAGELTLGGAVAGCEAAHLEDEHPGAAGLSDEELLVHADTLSRAVWLDPATPALDLARVRLSGALNERLERLTPAGGADLVLVTGKQVGADVSSTFGEGWAQEWAPGVWALPTLVHRCVRAVVAPWSGPEEVAAMPGKEVQEALVALLEVPGCVLTLAEALEAAAEL
jgi:hypothetical protein